MTATMSAARSRTHSYLWPLILSALGVVLFTPMMLRWTQMVPSDYEVHNQLATQVVDAPQVFFTNTPHFLYHVAVALPYGINTRITPALAATLVMVVTYLATLLIIYAYLRQQAQAAVNTAPAQLMLAALALGLMVLTPISFFTPDTLYFGYYTPHVYHNPTVNMMKPFALVLFIACVPLFYTKARLSWRWLPAYAVLTAACLLAKPSFVIALLPALAVLTAIVMALALPIIIRAGWRDYLAVIWHRINWPILLGSVVFPATALLYLQTITWTSSGGIAFEPLRTQLEWSIHYDETANQLLVPKLLLSAAFPLVVYLLHLRRAARSIAFNLGWLTFGVGVAMTLLLTDYSGIAAGDFGWSAQGGALVLFVAAAGFLVNDYISLFINPSADRPRQVWRLGVCALVLVAHIAAGIHWYLLHLSYGSLELLYGVW